MAKKAVDRNLERRLANLGKYPDTLKQAQEVYLYRVIKKASFQEVGKHFGFSTTTAWKFHQAYKPVADQYKEDPTVQEVLAFVYHEMWELITKREKVEGDTQEYVTFTKEIRHYQGMVNELGGLTVKTPTVQINVINNFVGEVVEIINRNVDDEATRRRIGEELCARGRRLIGDGEEITVPATVAGESG